MNIIKIFPFVILMNCIGVDEVDDPIVGESIVVDQDQIALLIGDTTNLSATYFDQYGIE